MDDSFEYLDLSQLSITSNGLSIEEETIENLLGVLLYQLSQNLTAIVQRTLSAKEGGMGGVGGVNAGMAWNSPDLNPIENMWTIMKDKVAYKQI